MRIGINAYLMHGGDGYRAAGVSVYTEQLVRHLPAVAPDLEFVVFHGHDAPPVAGVQSSLSPVPTSNPLARIAWEQVGLPLQALLHRIDILHGTVNVAPLVSPIPNVVTIHDLSFLHFPEQFPHAKALYLRWAVRASCARARAMIAVSNHTRDDLMEYFDVPGDRVSVVYSGVDPRFREFTEEERSTFRSQTFGGRPYILHVGTLQPRKNIDVLIQAYARLKRFDGLPHALALVGGRGWMYDSLFTLVRGLDLEHDVRFVEYVAPVDLPLWYNCADVFAFPSAYEGFGLPVLEAMACGVPVVTSNTSSLRELAHDICVTVTPGSIDELQDGISRVLGDEQLRKQMRAAGLKRAAQLTWENTAIQTLQVYRSAMRR